jgi:hypothetical protein
MIIYYNFTFFLVSLIEGQNLFVSFAHFVLLVSASFLSEVTWTEISKSKLGPRVSFDFSVLRTTGIEEGEGLPL